MNTKMRRLNQIANKIRPATPTVIPADMTISWDAETVAASIAKMRENAERVCFATGDTYRGVLATWRRLANGRLQETLTESGEKVLNHEH